VAYGDGAPSLSKERIVEAAKAIKSGRSHYGSHPVHELLRPRPEPEHAYPDFSRQPFCEADPDNSDPKHERCEVRCVAGPSVLPTPGSRVEALGLRALVQGRVRDEASVRGAAHNGPSRGHPGEGCTKPRAILGQTTVVISHQIERVGLPCAIARTTVVNARELYYALTRPCPHCELRPDEFRSNICLCRGFGVILALRPCPRAPEAF
jgi:hypothetical protein